MSPQRLTEVPPVGIRQPDVDHQRIRWVKPRTTHRLGPARGPMDGEALTPKATGEHSAKLEVVLDQQDV
jgi:hypothetical protein